MKIPFNRPYVTGREMEYIRAVVESGRFTGNGEFSRKCARRLEEITGCRKAILVPSGTAALEMHDANENRRIGLRVQHSTPSITIFDAEEKGRGQLSMKDNGSPFISVIGANEKSMAGLTINDDDTPWFDMRDETGKPRVVLSFLPSGMPFMGFKDSRGNIAWRTP